MIRLTACVLVGFLVVTLQESELPIQFTDAVLDGSTDFRSRFQQKQYVVELPDEHVGPVWTGDLENPPFSAAEAIRAAIGKRQEFIPDTDLSEWRFCSISLQPWDHANGYWYWRVVFQRHFKDDSSFGPPFVFRMAVLMDGTVIEPTISDWSP